MIINPCQNVCTLTTSDHPFCKTCGISREDRDMWLSMTTQGRIDARDRAYNRIAENKLKSETLDVLNIRKF